MEVTDPYIVLGVSHNATQREITLAYRALSKKHHPDVSKLPNAESVFKGISEAYALVGDTEARFNFDHGITGHNFRAEYPSQAQSQSQAQTSSEPNPPPPPQAPNPNLTQEQIDALLDEYSARNEKLYREIEDFLTEFKTRYTNLFENLIHAFHDRPTGVLGFIVMPSDIRLLIFDKGPLVRMDVAPNLVMDTILDHLEFDAKEKIEKIRKNAEQLSPLYAQAYDLDRSTLSAAQQLKILRLPPVGDAEFAMFKLHNDMAQAAHTVDCELYSQYNKSFKFGSSIPSAVDAFMADAKTILDDINSFIAQAASDYYADCKDDFSSFKGKISKVRMRNDTFGYRGSTLARRIGTDQPHERYAKIRDEVLAREIALRQRIDDFASVIGSDPLIVVSTVATGIGYAKADELRYFISSSGIKDVMRDFELTQTYDNDMHAFGISKFYDAADDAFYDRELRANPLTL